MKYKVAALALAIASLSGCDEIFNENENTPDGSVSDISVSAPSENSAFTHGQAVEIRSVITDKDNLKQVDVRVIDVNNTVPNKVVWGFTKYPEKKLVNQIDTAFAASALPAGNYLLTINTVDGRTNAGSKEIKFSVK